MFQPFNANSLNAQRRLTTVPLQSSAARVVGGASPRRQHDTPYAPKKGEYTLLY